MLAAYKLKESGLNRLIRASYDLLGLIQYFTAGEPEVRAWTIRRGMNAVKAAGVIHSDIEKHFIRAEVVSCKDLLAAAASPRRAKRPRCAWKGRNTSCRKAT